MHLDEEEEESRAAVWKKLLLGEDSLAMRLLNKIIDNIQIHVSDIHIRYEDNVSNPKHAFVLGVRLDHFSAVSTDDAYVPFSSPSDSFVSAMLHKVFQHFCFNLVPDLTFVKAYILQKFKNIHEHRSRCL